MKNKDDIEQALITLNIELASQREENLALAAKLVFANTEITEISDERKKHAEELLLAKIELDLQSNEKEELAAKLVIANISRDFEGKEKEKRADELILANIELAFQSLEKEKRAEELIMSEKKLALEKAVRWYLDQGKEQETEKFILANIDVASQNNEKDLLVNQLAFQENEKSKQAAKLIMSYKELSFQMEEKGKRAAELIVANIELAFQNTEKEKRAEELIIANKELVFQNGEKEKRAAELVIANKQLALQNEAEAKRAAALVVANIELIFQNGEKEKRTAELVVANKELKQFAYIASHDLQEPLRTISNYIEAFELEHFHLLGQEAKQYIHSINQAARRMSTLVGALLDFSRIGRDKKMALVDCSKIVSSVLEDLRALIKSSKASVVVVGVPLINACEIEIHQLFRNLITNAIKFVKKDIQPKIQIQAVQLDKKWKFSVSDNGIGIDSIHFDRVFDLFQRLHSHETYVGDGIGLANCKKIVQLHQGEIWIESTVGQGTTFHFTIPS